jgi:hypothetical protein
VERRAIYPKGMGVKIRVEDKFIGVIHYLDRPEEPWVWRKIRYRKIWGETGSLKGALRELCDACEITLNSEQEEVFLNSINSFFQRGGWLFKTPVWKDDQFPRSD